MSTPQLRRAALTPAQLVSAYGSQPQATRAAPPATTRSITSAGPGRVGGYVALWNSLSGDLGGFREKLKRGAFTRSLELVKEKKADVLFFVEHDSRAILGRLSAGNLALYEDSHGLAFTLELPPTTLGRDTATLVSRGILKGCSFAFSPVHEHWEKVAGESIRELSEVRLFECSIVSTPAYASTSVTAIRSKADSAYWTAARLRARTGHAHYAGVALAKQRSVTGGIQWR